MQRQSTIKVGFMALVSIGLLIFVLIWLRGRGIQTGETFDIAFDDVDGLREGAAVQLMGIRVGFIDEIDPKMDETEYKVRVKFSVNRPDINIPKGSLLSIEQSGIIGEKFLEITPPYDRVLLTKLSGADAALIQLGTPIKKMFKQGALTVGEVKTIKPIQQAESEATADPIQKLTNKLALGDPYASSPTHRLTYRISKAGVFWPDEAVSFSVEEEAGKPYLLLKQTELVLAEQPDEGTFFTIENPLRLKQFLEIQLESAAALKITNDKLSQLLSDENIASLSSTVKNTETLTAQANDVLKNANELFQIAGNDLESLVQTSEKLAANLIEVSDNVNAVIGNPDLKEDILATVSSIEKSTTTLAALIDDPALKETIALIEDTSQDASVLVKSLKSTVASDDFQKQVTDSSKLLNQSLDKLNLLLSSVNEAAVDEDENLKLIIQEARETTKNLKQFSDKLNGRFTLFRLLF